MTSGKTEKAVFFGSGPVAARCLELLTEHVEIEAVITKPRPPHHKGAVPVLELAETLGLPALTARNKAELDQLMTACTLTSRYAILIDFGIIVSRRVIDYFPLGIINSHFSLLPRLRGADPITWAIANGDEESGVSLMLIDEGMDTGRLITQKSLYLASNETTPTLTEKLIQLSDELLHSHLPHYLAGDITPRNQPHPDRATYSRKLTKADGRIDLVQPAALIERQIRAFLGWPGSRTKLGSLDIIITQAHVSHQEEELSLLCGDGNYLVIDRLKPAGKKEMPREAFLAGYKHII